MRSLMHYQKPRTAARLRYEAKDGMEEVGVIGVGGGGQLFEKAVDDRQARAEVTKDLKALHSSQQGASNAR